MEKSPGLFGLIGVLVALVLGLHQVGGIADLAVDWSDPVRWVETVPPEYAIGGFVRQIGLIMGYWVLASVAIHGWAICRDAEPGWVRVVAFPGVRRLVDRAMAASLAISILGAPAGMAAASESPPPAVFETAADGIPVPHVTYRGPVSEPASGDRPPLTIEQPAPPVLLSVPVPPTASIGDRQPGPETIHTVVPGDNLWRIAEARLEATVTTSPTAAEIAGYWHAVVAINTPTLRSGDPNLIYPGELITLPPAEQTQ